MSELLKIETTREAAECIMNAFSSKDLRRLASNLAVSRERGDTKMQTAERIAAQRPAVTALMLENDWEVDMDASEFREHRETEDGPISLEEAERRAPSAKLRSRLHELRIELTALPSYRAEVDWDYGGSPAVTGWDTGLTSVTVKRCDDWDGSGLAAYRAHAILRPTGAARRLSVSSMGTDRDYAEQYSEHPLRAWRRFVNRIESFYDPETY